MPESTLKTGSALHVPLNRHQNKRAKDPAISCQFHVCPPCSVATFDASKMRGMMVEPPVRYIASTTTKSPSCMPEGGVTVTVGPACVPLSTGEDVAPTSVMAPPGGGGGGGVDVTVKVNEVVLITDPAVAVIVIG